MDREYLEDYNQKALDEYKRLVARKVLEGNFSFEKDKYPPDNRFTNLQKPVGLLSLKAAHSGNLWATVPFCGSSVLPLSPYPPQVFERYFFKITEIPKIIDFIKETGRLQVALRDAPIDYVGLDYLDPFFKELKPPVIEPVPFSIFANEKEVQTASDAFFTLGKVKFLEFLRKASEMISSRMFNLLTKRYFHVFVTLKLGHFTLIEDIESLMIDDPSEAVRLLSLYGRFITNPLRDLRFDLRNFSLEDIRESRFLPLVYRPREVRFPCEIGKFLLEKLTYAPKGMRACNELIDHYDAYDLQKVLESMNEAVVANHPDIINKSAQELSEILDNIWKDPTIPRLVKGLKIGVPLSMAVVGSVAAGPIGAAGGFLAGLGFNVAHRFINIETAGLSEKLAKMVTKSYQANIFDFKKKYKGQIAHR